MNPQEPNNTITTSPSSKTSSNVTILAMAIFVILSLSSVAFLWYQNQQLKKMVLSYQTQQIQPTPDPLTPSSSIKDETVNWKTYTNTKYGFSLKYPETLNLNPKEADMKANYAEYIKNCNSGKYEGCGGSAWPDNRISFLRDDGNSAFDVNIWNTDYSEIGFGVLNNNKTFGISTDRQVGQWGEVEPVDESVLENIKSTLTFN